jgi:hypothetical protein
MTFATTSTAAGGGNNSSVTYLGRLGSVETTLGRLFRVFGQASCVFLTITTSAYMFIWAVTWVLVGLATALVDSLFTSNSGEDNYGYDDGGGGNENSQDSSAHTLSVLELLLFEVGIAWVIFYVVMCAADGAIIRAVAELYVGKSPNAVTAVAKGFNRVGPLLGVTFLLGVCVYFPIFIRLQTTQQPLLIVCCVVLLVLVGLVTYHVYPVIMVEGQGVCGSLRRSFELSSDHRCYLFTTLFGYGILKFVPMGIVAALIRRNGTVESINHSKGAAIMLTLLDMMLKILFASFGSM